MTASYPVNWKSSFKSIMVMVYVSTTGLTLLILVIRSAFFDLSVLKKIVTIFSLEFLVVYIIATILILAISLTNLARTISVSGGVIYGRSFWGKKNSIPLKSIDRGSWDTTAGLGGIFIESDLYGSIFISNETIELDQLIAKIDSHLPEGYSLKTGRTSRGRHPR